MPARGRAWTEPTKLQAKINTAALSEVDKNAWRREHGIYPAELAQWCGRATTEVAEPQAARASPEVTRQGRKCIKELERELLRKDRALAETPALLVLSKKSRRSTTGARTHDPHRRSPQFGPRHSDCPRCWCTPGAGV